MPFQVNMATKFRISIFYIYTFFRSQVNLTFEVKVKHDTLRLHQARVSWLEAPLKQKKPSVFFIL